jgi:hypothetical protein
VNDCSLSKNTKRKVISVFYFSQLIKIYWAPQLGPLFFILGPLWKSRKNKVLFVENLIFNLKNKIQNFQFLQVFLIFNKNYISNVLLSTAVALNSPHLELKQLAFSVIYIVYLILYSHTQTCTTLTATTTCLLSLSFVSTFSQNTRLVIQKIYKIYHFSLDFSV